MATAPEQLTVEEDSLLDAMFAVVRGWEAEGDCAAWLALEDMKAVNSGLHVPPDRRDELLSNLRAFVNGCEAVVGAEEAAQARASLPLWEGLLAGTRKPRW